MTRKIKLGWKFVSNKFVANEFGYEVKRERIKGRGGSAWVGYLKWFLNDGKIDTYLTIYDSDIWVYHGYLAKETVENYLNNLVELHWEKFELGKRYDSKDKIRMV